jgi:hypothetical protein
MKKVGGGKRQKLAGRTPERLPFSAWMTNRAGVQTHVEAQFTGRRAESF